MGLLPPKESRSPGARRDSAPGALTISRTASFNRIDLSSLPTRQEDSASLQSHLAFEATYGHLPSYCWTPDGGRLIRAWWPAYPVGLWNLTDSLAALAEFPEETVFYPIAVADDAVLYLAGQPAAQEPFSEKLFHVSLWETVTIEGLSEGYLKIHSRPSASFGVNPISLTPRGRRFAIFDDLTQDMYTELVAHVSEFVVAGRFDTAIREAGVYLENTLRRVSGASKAEYGLRLVDFAFRVTPHLLPPILPAGEGIRLKARLRRFFSFVRNEYAHHLEELDLLATFRILTRCQQLVRGIQRHSTTHVTASR